MTSQNVYFLSRTTKTKNYHYMVLINKTGINMSNNWKWISDIWTIDHYTIHALKKVTVEQFLVINVTSCKKKKSNKKLLN